MDENSRVSVQVSEPGCRPYETVMTNQRSGVGGTNKILLTSDIMLVVLRNRKNSDLGGDGKKL